MPNEQEKKAVAYKKHVARQQRERQQARLILYTFFGILAAVVLLLIYGLLDERYFKLQRPVAKVGETKILVRDFEPRVRLQRQQLLSQYSQYAQYAQVFGLDVEAQLQQIASNLDSPQLIGQTVLDQMVNEEVIRQEAAKLGITVSEAELDEALQSAFGFFPNGTPTPSATPTAVDMPEIPAEAFNVVTVTPVPSATPEMTSTPAAAEAETTPAEGETTPEAEVTAEPSLTPTATSEPSATPTEGPTSTPAPTATPYTFESFQQNYQEVNEDLAKLGFTHDVYRRLFEVQILERKLRDELALDVPRTSPQVWARHILVSDAATAQTVIERLQNGEDFAALALELSSDTGSAVNGGDLGWFGSGVMVPEFEAAAFALENSGDFTTEPVQSNFGFHIIQLIAKQDRPLSAEQYASERELAFAGWLADAKEAYGVETYDVWKQRVPSEPNFITQATEAAGAQLTAQAEVLEGLKATATP
ncbi:MAG: peptidylprolyl isomerase [Anaerolineales bacterium]|nr:MAG: peptidylprolyl isomerase [Anaerolineales bacterium]